MSSISLTIPLELEVFGFDFPDTVACETAFGLDHKKINTLQRLTNDGYRKTVFEKYLGFYAKHHLCPYRIDTFTPSPMRPKWKDGHPVFDWTAWDAEIERVLAKYHFNAFRISIAGIGGGDMSGPSKQKRRMNGAEIGTPEFELYFERYIKAVEAHLVEKGWIDKVYVYVYDEPRPSHYAYIREALARMRKYAPRIRRMVTAQPMEPLDGVNLWCPITYKFDREKCAEARAKGEQIWWYVTFSSKVPHINEHVEHAGVDNRVWLWQTWQEKIRGVLIWQTNFWTNDKVYPEGPQNPYLDAICWGGKGPWNSGEGRYFYPPMACFDGGSEPVLEGPVDSIRMEMLREGVEDFEYFALLKKLDPKNPLLEVPAEVSTSKTEYSYDPAAMEAHRAKLAKAISDKWTCQ